MMMNDWSENHRYSLVPAEELCRRNEHDCGVFMAEKGITPETNLDKFPWEYESSDHRPVQYINNITEIKLFSLNLLNPKNAKYLAKEEGFDGSQRITESACAVGVNDEGRLRALARLVVRKVSEGFIVCLQEVGAEFDALLKEALSSYIKSAFYTHVSEFDRKYDSNVYNCNMILFDLFTYELINIAGFLQINKWLPMLFLRHRVKGTNCFGVMNVHMKFKTNNLYLDLFKHIAKSQKPFFICGDFNCSSRFPKRDQPNDHLMDYYADPMFKFAIPQGEYTTNSKGFVCPVFTHVNKFTNAKSTYDQLDCFDYIMQVLPEAVTF